MQQVAEPLLKDLEAQQPSKDKDPFDEDGRERSVLEGWWPMIASQCVLAAGMPCGAMAAGAAVALGALLLEGRRALNAREEVAVFPKTLDVGQIVVYTLLAIVLLACPASRPAVAEWNGPILNMAYTIMFVPGLLRGQPLYLEYARESAPSWLQRHPTFLPEVYFYTKLFLGLLLAMTCSSLVPPVYQALCGRKLFWAWRWAFELAQYLLLIYGLTKPRRDSRRKAVQFGFGLADHLPAGRPRHPPMRLADAEGKVLPWIAGSGRIHPRPLVIYKRPGSSLSDLPPNMQVKAAPSLGKMGIPRGPWDMKYKAFFELDDRPRKCALLVDDVQVAYGKFFDDGYLRAQVSVLEAARAGGIPVVWSVWSRTDPDDGHYCTYDEFYGPYGAGDFKGMNATYLRTPACKAIIEELRPRTAEEQRRVIESVHMDCFGNKDETGQSILKTYLDSWGVDTLVLTGCWTDACVIATCIRAVTEDFNVILPEDAVFSCTAAAGSALDVMRNLYAKIVPAREVSAYLRSAASD